mgnify:CR=1 FL=1
MDRKEFFKWLNACPTHKFEVVYDDYNGVYVNFTIADAPTPYVPDRFALGAYLQSRPGYEEEKE